jgi:hypothetical protein
MKCLLVGLFQSTFSSRQKYSPNTLPAFSQARLTSFLILQFTHTYIHHTHSTKPLIKCSSEFVSEECFQKLCRFYPFSTYSLFLNPSRSYFLSLVHLFIHRRPYIIRSIHTAPALALRNSGFLKGKTKLPQLYLYSLYVRLNRCNRYKLLKAT